MRAQLYSAALLIHTHLQAVSVTSHRGCCTVYTLPSSQQVSPSLWPMPYHTAVTLYTLLEVSGFGSPGCTGPSDVCPAGMLPLV
jgi:hypothetical protein